MENRFRNGNLIVASSPHLQSDTSTTHIMAQVLMALFPAFAFAVWQYGARAIFLTTVCIVSSVLFEYLFNKIRKQKQTVGDLSAAVTGLLLAFNLPVTLPYWIAVIGCFIAIVIVKQFFGGLGQNFANPAITARIVLFISFAPQMTNWAVPGHIFKASDAVTSATPLGILQGGNVLELPSNMDMFVGSIGGSLGEVSGLALLLGGVFLMIRKIITPTIPIAFISTVAIFAVCIGEDPIFHICAGGVMLGAFFMATDYATSPITEKGKLIFGIGCGLLTMLIRMYSAYPEGVSFAILLMNILVPHIDKLTKRKLYGGGDNEK
ncbi:MAG: RnfABCDGE type electron transport complex subunit D [Anaerovoracaceae bacterium]